MPHFENDRFELLRSAQTPIVSTLADDVRRGLAKAPRSLPPKHFYDAAGSILFDRICELPEYYLTRAERALLETHADAIVERAGPIDLIELGSGMARKTGLLLSAMARRGSKLRYLPIDIAESALEASARELLGAHPGLTVRAVVGDFQRELPLLRRAIEGEGPRRRLFAFLGSTMGNLDEVEAPALIASIAAEMRPGDTFLLGVDLVKDRRTLEQAYDDSAGVTACFNRNVLAIVNRELGADFDLEAFEHHAPWVEARSRMEMHLRARSPQRITIASLGMSITIEQGESILTEISRKFTREAVESTLGQGGLELDQWMTGTDRAFALVSARLAAR